MGIIYKNGIPYGNQPYIDATLTHQGEAADAKAVGDEIRDVRNTLSHKADLIYDTASGDIASFPDGADGLPVKDLTVAIEPVQDLHGYDNPWPGGGGSNKLPTNRGYSFPYNASIGSVLDTTTTVPDWTDEGNGIFTITLGDWARSGWLSDKLETGNTYVFKATVVSGSPRTSVYVLDNNFAVTRVTGTANPSIDNSQYLYGFELENNECYIAFAIIGKNQKITVKEPQVVKGSTEPSTFAPYSNICPISGWIGCNISHSGADTSDPTVIPISWQSSAGTVYGGTLDVTSGVLTVTDANIASYNGETLPGEWISDRDVYSEGATPTTGAQVVYKLAQPQTYQLDPVTVNTLLGQNNIWADCGPSTVEYPADTKLYIQKINTPTDDDMIADANIASGQYFIVNNNLYISTAAILAGDPIKPGTNCTLTNLAAALNALNS
jgi:hypothetical protein